MLRALLVLLTILATAPAWAANADFLSWLEGLRSEAAGKGISARTLTAALNGLQPIPRVIELDRRQPETTLTFAEYMARVVPDQRIQTGRDRLAENAAVLEPIAARYGVPARFIVALWAMESDFGRITGNFNVIGALATLAYEGRRASFFRRELLEALAILDQEGMAPAQMTGSWAGAMGQSQFMPSSFRRYAVDYDGDGRRNIWTSRPDVFASAANYLAREGWKADQTWGRRVLLPGGFDTRQTGLEVIRPLSEWQAMGVRAADGGPLPQRDIRASVVIPDTGAPAYLVYDNFRVILKWNRSKYFGIAVGTLADAIGGQ